MKLKFVKTTLFVFVLIVLAYALFMTFRDIKNNMPPKEPYENEPNLKICLYKASWCGHCTKYLESGVFESTFDSIKTKPEFKDVVFVTIDFDENKDLAEKYGVNSFPSIIAIDRNGKLLSQFEGDRYKKEDLIGFVKENKSKV